VRSHGTWAASSGADRGNPATGSAISRTFEIAGPGPGR
jgi:hypothetical protein